jgi:ankyrin repeat protein
MSNIILGIIKRLEEKESSWKELESELNSNKNLRTSIHKNTYLLEAISRNYLTAAKKLLEWDIHKEHLNLQDSFITCKNTPLILAAKTHANSILRELIILNAELNTQDYRGFTALHYACLYRNEEAIGLLLNAGARIDLMTQNFGSKWCCFYNKKDLYALSFYQMKITFSDLKYAYGQETEERLKHQCDNSLNYYGTRKKQLSALVWFIGHIILNKNTDMQLSTDEKNEIQTQGLSTHIKNAALYDKLMQGFCDSRTEIQPETLTRLDPFPVIKRPTILQPLVS